MLEELERCSSRGYAPLEGNALGTLGAPEFRFISFQDARKVSVLRAQERFKIELVPFDEDELEQEVAATVPEVLGWGAEPVAEGPLAEVGEGVERARRAVVPGLSSDGAHKLPGLEVLNGPVDLRTLERPNRTQLTALGENRSQLKAVRRSLT